MSNGRINLRINEEERKRAEGSLELSNSSSLNEHIIKAIKFYNVYLQLDGDPDIFSKIVGNIVESKIKQEISRAIGEQQGENERINRNLFKVAVEVSKVSHILADNLEINAEDMDKRHLKAVEEVKGINGTLGIDD